MTIDSFPLEAEFSGLMSNLPVPVPDEDIEEMFSFADQDRDGELTYEEFASAQDAVLRGMHIRNKEIILSKYFQISARLSGLSLLRGCA